MNEIRGRQEMEERGLVNLKTDQQRLSNLNQKKNRISVTWRGKPSNRTQVTETEKRENGTEKIYMSEIVAENFSNLLKHKATD